MTLFAFLFAAVTVVRVPDGGVQPQIATAADGAVHMVYLTGPPAASDIVYRRSADGMKWSEPLRVNSKPGAAIASGTVRGPHIAVSPSGRVHVVWMGSSNTGKPAPLLYARLAPGARAFEAERNLIRTAWGLDGGASIAASGRGVFVFWHAPLSAAGEEHGEQWRRVWMAASPDEGSTFTPERVIFDRPVGACACCALRAAAEESGGISVLFRSAREVVHRDMYRLASRDGGQSFSGAKVDEWEAGQCVMSTAAIAGEFSAWETRGQIMLSIGRGAPVAAPGEGKRKHPALARNKRGATLLVWAEDTGWNRGGSIAWQVFDSAGRALAERGRTDGLPVWGSPAAFARAGGAFVIVY
jgi:hypothetical protein